jgi:ribonuclease D
MTIYLHEGDLPRDVFAPGPIAVDSETLGLNPLRDRLCLLQLADGQGDEHLVRFEAGKYDAPVLRGVLADPNRIKLFHFARFDLAVIKHYLGVDATPVFCTKIASKLVRTYTDRHGLKDLLKESVGVDISKQQQSSDWGADTLTAEQMDYAAADVLHLHKLKAEMDRLLAREKRAGLASACFAFLPDRAALDVAGWADEDIFAH